MLNKSSNEDRGLAELADGGATAAEYVTDIVSSYVANNHVPLEQLPALIASVHAALQGLGKSSPAAEVPKATSAQIKKSIRPDGLISFIDGKPYKTLKRHLARHGLTIAEYKAQFGLPSDYPSTAPDYSAKRSEMARTLGLGRKSNNEAAAAPANPAASGRRRASRSQ